MGLGGNEFGELGSSIPGWASTEATGVMQGLRLLSELVGFNEDVSSVCSLFLSTGGEEATGFDIKSF